MNPPFKLSSAAGAMTVLAVLAHSATAQTATPAATQTAAEPTQLAPVVVRGNYNTAIGSTDAASAGTVNSKLIDSRPTLRPAEVLETIPGLVVTQHSGDGKAN